MNETERQAEIEKIEHELRLLQRRYANLERAAKRMRLMTYLLVLGFIGVFVAGVLSIDLLGGGIVLAFMVPAGLGFCAVWRRFDTGGRWIDSASVPFGWWGAGMKRTEAMGVEDMVAERMERLARLRGNC
jgi:hypothetical protein